MSPNFAMSVMGAVEFGLWAALAFFFWKKKLEKRFPAMRAYLILHVIATPVLALMYMSTPLSSNRDFLISRFFLYWTVYIASAVLLFFICTEVFRSALSALPGLRKLGIVAFRWVTLASVIVTLSSVSFSHRGFGVIPDIALGLMRSMSILELCLLGFLCVSMNALRMSVRDAAFGISMGLGLMASNDFVAASLISRHALPTAPLQFIYEAATLAVLCGWAAFFALPEPVRKPVVLPVTSTIFRWNEIATALGHSETQIAIQPASGFFLTDVEQVVERVLARNRKNRESET
jgi:hypothetical protein